MNTLEEFLDLQVAKYCFSFTKEKLKSCLDKEDTALKRAIDRAKEKKKVFSLRKGFYLILPPRYRLLGKLPIQLYISNLMEYVDRPYYLGLLSAAKFHGATHHALQKDFVLTQSPPLRAIDNKAYRIDFHIRSLWPTGNIELKKSEAGRYNISSVALTIVDLINYQNKIGGLSNLITTIAELSEDLQEKDLSHLLSWYRDISDIQRLGYLLEWLQLDGDLVLRVEEWLAQKTTQEVVLAPGQHAAFSEKNKWKVNPNIELELEV